MLVALCRGGTQSLVPSAVMLPKSRILKFRFTSVLNGDEESLPHSLLELFKLEAGKHPVACADVLCHLLPAL